MKRKNPETSLIAHQNKSLESKQRDYDDIVRAYQKLGSGIYTDVATFLGWGDAAKVNRRMAEMRRLDILENTGIKKLTPRHRPAFIHQLKSQPQSVSMIVDKIIEQAHHPNSVQQDLF